VIPWKERSDESKKKKMLMVIILFPCTPVMSESEGIDMRRNLGG